MVDSQRMDKKKNWCRHEESNSGPTDYKSVEDAFSENIMHLVATPVSCIYNHLGVKAIANQCRVSA